MHLGFVPGRRPIGALFHVRQLQEKYLAKRKPLLMAFVNQEKDFNRVPSSVIWCSLGMLRVDEWLVRTIQIMYKVPSVRCELATNTVINLVTNDGFLVSSYPS